MSTPPVLSAVAAPGQAVSPAQIADLVARACPVVDYDGRRALLIVPDGTRTAPIDRFFRALHARIDPVTAQLDVMIALGTHQPMSEAAIRERLGISLAERAGRSRAGPRARGNRPPAKVGGLL